jgi:hypothetical protein
MTSSSQRAAQAPDAARPLKTTDLKRRRFLFALGAGGAGAAAVATTALRAPVAVTAVEGDADAGQGYRETEHVRDYYATTRI